MSQPIRNIAILAHVDAGKTTLSERILFAAGEVRRPGRVEDGLATMDYMPEEKERGITIESGVAHFEWKDSWFNFIDTPGHVDFGAEVDMALSAVEGAVLVVSAASGVETQTIAAFKKLREAGVRTILFVNKLDNPDYSLDDTLINIEEILGVRPVLMTLPQYENGRMTGVLDVLSQCRLTHSDTGEEVVDDGWNVEDGWDGSRELKQHYAEAVEFASNFDDEVLKLAMDGKRVPPKMLLRALKALANSDDYALCYAGSAMEGFGVRSLVTALTFFLPDVPEFNEGELGQVIRLRHFKGVGEISLFRSHTDMERKAWPAGFEFSRLKANLLQPVDEIRSGDIYAMRTPFETELGQILKVTPEGRSDLIPQSDQGERPHASIRDKYQPLLQTRVECLGSEDYHHVEKSLNTLSRMDPSFGTCILWARCSWMCCWPASNVNLVAKCEPVAPRSAGKNVCAVMSALSRILSNSARTRFQLNFLRPRLTATRMIFAFRLNFWRPLPVKSWLACVPHCWNQPKWESLAREPLSVFASKSMNLRGPRGRSRP